MKFNDIDSFDLDLPLDLHFDEVGYEDLHKLTFNPTHANIGNDEVVDVVKDASVIKTDSWINIMDWLYDTYDDLNGEYSISKGGMVVHKFTIVH